MPLERVSQGFRDVSMSFKKNPLNDDLILLKNANAIARSIKNIVFTFPGEKPFNETFGSRVSRLLFDNFDDLTASNIKDEIESVNSQEFGDQTQFLSANKGDFLCSAILLAVRLTSIKL